MDSPASALPGRGRRFPGWPGPVLVMSVENQGVCSWGVPLDGADDPVVLVGGELLDAGDATVPYADSVQDFIAARRWDGRCLAGSPLLQAQAPELESSALGRLRALLAPAVAMAGWPGARQDRFEGPGGARVLLLSQAGQCDWWISAAAREPLRALAAGLLDLPGLSAALSPCDDEGARVLDQLLDSPR